MSRSRMWALVGVGAAVIALLAGACALEATPEPRSQSSPGRTPAAQDVVAGLPEWEPRPGLSVPRDDFGTVVIGHEIWVFGGMTGDRGTRLESVEVFDTRTEQWRVSDIEMPVGLASFEAAAIGDEVFVLGGLDADGTATDFAAVLDVGTGRWRRLPPLPVGRYSHTVTVHDGLVYVIGGEGGRGPVRRVDVLDPDTRTWSTAAAMPKARGSHRAVSVGDVIYVLGGWRHGAASDLVQTLDPVADRWESVEPLPEPMSRAGAAFLDGRLWVSLHEGSYVLDVDEGTWSPANPLTVSRHGLGYVAYEDRIYGIGGCTPSPLRDVRTVDVLEVT